MNNEPAYGIGTKDCHDAEDNAGGVAYDESKLKHQIQLSQSVAIDSLPVEDEIPVVQLSASCEKGIHTPLTLSSL